MPQINIQALRETFDLRAFVSPMLGQMTHHYQYDVYRCPKHSDRSASLTIYDHSWYCYGCNQGGSVFDFLIYYKNIPFTQALEEANRNSPQYLLEQRVERPITTTSIPMSLVEQNAQNILKGLPYFEKRGISDPTSYQIPLGVKLNYRSSYQLSDGSWFNCEAPRYAVPNIFNNTVRSINYRRDDAAFLEAFFSKGDHHRVMDDLSIHYDGSPESNLLNVVAGAKYKQEPGSKWKPFNVQTVVKRENGKNVPIPQPYLLVYAEAKEFDVLGAMDAGYPIVGVTFTHEIEPILPRLFEHIPLLYIIRDNDEAGMRKAVKLQEILGRGRITSSPIGKDVGDAIQEGQLDKWFNGQLGLEKIR